MTHSCPECSKTVDPAATACPDCGFPLDEVGPSKARREAHGATTTPRTPDATQPKAPGTRPPWRIIRRLIVSPLGPALAGAVLIALQSPSPRHDWMFGAGVTCFGVAIAWLAGWAAWTTPTQSLNTGPSMPDVESRTSDVRRVALQPEMPALSEDALRIISRARYVGAFAAGMILVPIAALWVGHACTGTMMLIAGALVVVPIIAVKSRLAIPESFQWMVDRKARTSKAAFWEGVASVPVVSGVVIGGLFLVAAMGDARSPGRDSFTIPSSEQSRQLQELRKPIGDRKTLPLLQNPKPGGKPPLPTDIFSRPGDPAVTSRFWRDVVISFFERGRTWGIRNDEALQSQSVAEYVRDVEARADRDLTAIQEARIGKIDSSVILFTGTLQRKVEKLRENCQAMADTLEPHHSIFTISGLCEAARNSESPLHSKLSPRLRGLALEHARLVGEQDADRNQMQTIRASLSKRYPKESFPLPR